jgi:hypothetical protein
MTFPFGIERFKLSQKERPRRYRLDLSKEAIASRQALFGVILKIREACFYRSSPLDRSIFIANLLLFAWKG